MYSNINAVDRFFRSPLYVREHENCLLACYGSLENTVDKCTYVFKPIFIIHFGICKEHARSWITLFFFFFSISNVFVYLFSRLITM